MAKIPPIIVTGISAKVMRSYDYCHFEIQLSAIGEEGLIDQQADALRKAAARLVDKAVEQYQIAKKSAEELLREQYGYDRLKHDVALFENNVPISERTPEQKALVKALKDYEFHNGYDYEDDFEPWWE